MIEKRNSSMTLGKVQESVDVASLSLSRKHNYGLLKELHDLKQRIEQARVELEVAFETAGDVLAPQVVKISQLLDVLIVDFMQKSRGCGHE